MLPTVGKRFCKLFCSETARQRGGRIWYIVYGIKRDGNEGMQVGELNRNDLSLKALFEFLDSAKKLRGSDDFSMTLVPQPGGALLATSGQMGDHPVLLIFSRGGLERALKPEFPNRGFNLGFVAWAPDGKVIYAAAVSPAKEKDGSEFSVAGIPVNGGPVRLISIAHLTKSVDAGEYGLYLHVDISHGVG